MAAVTAEMQTLAKDILEEINKDPDIADFRQYYGYFLNSLTLLAKGTLTAVTKNTLLTNLTKFNIAKEKSAELKALIEAAAGGRRSRKSRKTKRTRKSGKAKRHTRRR
jgi:hypothetical protein